MVGIRHRFKLQGTWRVPPVYYGGIGIYRGTCKLGLVLEPAANWASGLPVKSMPTVALTRAAGWFLLGSTQLYNGSWYANDDECISQSLFGSIILLAFYGSCFLYFPLDSILAFNPNFY